MPYKDRETYLAYQRAYHLRDPTAQRQRNKKYKKTHRATVNTARRKRYQERKEELQGKAVARYWRDPETRRAYTRTYLIAHPTAKTEWRKANPEAERAIERRRRAAKSNAAINDLTKKQWREIVAAWKSCCAYCGRKMKRLEQDHITPLSKQGNNTVHNIVPACRSCNAKKHAGPPLTPVQPLLLTIAEPKAYKRRLKAS